MCLFLFFCECECVCVRVVIICCTIYTKPRSIAIITVKHDVHLSRNKARLCCRSWTCVSMGDCGADGEIQDEQLSSCFSCDGKAECWGFGSPNESIVARIGCGPNRLWPESIVARLLGRMGRSAATGLAGHDGEGSKRGFVAC